MVGICPFILPLLVVAFSPLAALPLRAIPLVSDGPGIAVKLNSNSSAGLKRLLFSNDLQGGLWTPLARSAGEGWETVFPEPATIRRESEAERLEWLEAPSSGPVFVRFEEIAAPAFSEDEAASRFLQQATFGPTLAEIQDLAATGNDFGAWIDDQISLSPTYLWDVNESFTFEDNFPDSHKKGIVWCHAVVGADDQLRQRMAWALSQIFVISELGSNGRNEVDEWAIYYDIFLRNAFGNFRTILQEVTLSPKMGEYLTYADNRKASGVRKPDENYAREVMQLFTIGLWMLNRDGTLQLDAGGEAIPTYDNGDIETHARVFTGLRRAPNREGMTSGNRIDPMEPREDWHDTDEKVLFDGTVLPAGQTTIADVTALLDRLFAHPNTPPFIARLLIQRFSSSNPSPGYIDRVAQAFEDNGFGVRGDLGAVVKAILLDPEARNLTLTVDDGHGALREPMIRFIHLCRAFNLTSTRGDGAFLVLDLEADFKQFPFNSPSVFNFYLPDHQPNGTILRRGLFAPEFQILDEPSAVKGLNIYLELIRDGLYRNISNRGSPQGVLDFTTEIALASDVDALLDHLNLLLLAGRLTPANRAIIREAVVALPTEEAQARVERAAILIVSTPEFAVLQ